MATQLPFLPVEDLMSSTTSLCFPAGMQACAAAGQLEEARSLLQAMKAAGFDPDVRAFNILLKGCSLEGSSAMQQVPAILEAMEAAGMHCLCKGCPIICFQLGGFSRNWCVSVWQVLCSESSDLSQSLSIQCPVNSRASSSNCRHSSIQLAYSLSGHPSTIFLCHFWMVKRHKLFVMQRAATA